MAEVLNLKSRVIKTEDIRWRDLKYLQEEDFKNLSLTAMGRLKKSLQQNEFAQPFYVWKDLTTGDLYCLDGRHRGLAMEELEKEGAIIPEVLPATFIACLNKKEAAQMVLVYSSLYAKLTESGLESFLQTHELDFTLMNEFVDFPNIDQVKFLGDIDTDFTDRNQELDVNQFKDTIALTLNFPKDQYLAVKKLLELAKERTGEASNESLIIKLLESNVE